MRVEWLPLLGFCLITGIMVMILRQMHPAMAGLLSAVFGAMLLGTLLPQIKAYVDVIQRFLFALDIDAQYFKIMLKAMGIVLVTQLTMQVCQDLNAPSIAQRAEFLGRMAMLGVAIPVFIELTQMAVDVLQ